VRRGIKVPVTKKKWREAQSSFFGLLFPALKLNQVPSIATKHHILAQNVQVKKELASTSSKFRGLRELHGACTRDIWDRVTLISTVR